MNSSPIGGGMIDVNGIVTSLMQVERRPLTVLQKRETEIQSKLSAFGRVQGALSSLESALSKLQGLNAFSAMKATSSNDGVAVTAGSSAKPGRYAIVVSTLARAQSSASTAFADATASVGTGTFTIKDAQGAVAATIAIGGTGEPQTVAQLRDAINDAEAGVSAVLVNDAGGTRLVLTASESGTENAFTVETSGTPAAQLAGLTGAPSQPAANASFSLNGLPLTSSTNKLTDVVEGLTITLAKAQPSTTVDVTVEKDIDAAKSSVDDFIKAYNEAEKLFDDLMKYDANTRTGAVLNGDFALRQIQVKLRSILGASRTAAVGEYKRLSEVGIEVTSDGGLKLAEGKFRDAMTADAAKVTRLFTTTSTAEAEQGFGVRLRAAVKGFLDAEGALGARQEGLRASIRSIDQQQARLEARMTLIEERLRREYSRLDALVSNNQSQSAALANALNGLQGVR